MANLVGVVMANIVISITDKIDLTPHGTWECSWKDCVETWSGHTSSAPLDWFWIGRFSFVRLLAAGRIETIAI